MPITMRPPRQPQDRRVGSRQVQTRFRYVDFMASTLMRAPTARTYPISDLMRDLEGGRIRVPSFQRNYRWEQDDVLNLFDSIYRGYPIGSLLLWNHEAPQGPIQFGSLKVDAPAMSDALWVVDGQQRLTSMAGVLLSSGEGIDPRFSLYFDLQARRFAFSRRPTPQYWLPMNRVMDTRSLLRWLAELQRSGSVDEFVSTAEDVAKRFREYLIPTYIVETDDEATLRTIFDRLNTFGKSLKSAEIFHALHGGRRGAPPEDLRTMAAEISAIGFGTFDDNTLLRAVLALRGSDIYRDFRSEFNDDEDPSETFRAAASALQRAVTFLRLDGEIPHLRVLPYRYVIPVLARFFNLHPDPSPRSRMLLRRWIWRDALASDRRSTSVSFFREVVNAVDADENLSVQRLLKKAPEQIAAATFDNESARLNEARARANVAMMATWSPRSLVDGQKLDVSDHFERIPAPLAVIFDNPKLRSRISDRMLHAPTSSPLVSVIRDSSLFRSDSLLYGEVLESHGIPAQSLAALRAGDAEGFVKDRAFYLRDLFIQTAHRLTEWGASDRPPLASLLVAEDDD